MSPARLGLLSLCGVALLAQDSKPNAYAVPPGTRVPMVMINSVSTKHAAEGDRIYLETSYPILADGRIVIPPGSYVAGTVTASKRAGRVKGRSELYVRFDSLTLPNGVTRDFRARMGGLDGRANDEFDRAEGKIKGEGTKGQDAAKVAAAAGAGTSVGVIAGSAAGHTGGGTAIGAAAGATAGLMTVLLTRGQDVVLGRGTVVEMVLDRSLEFTESEVDFAGASGGRRSSISDEGPARKQSGSSGIPGQRPVLGIP